MSSVAHVEVGHAELLDVAIVGGSFRGKKVGGSVIYARRSVCGCARAYATVLRRGRRSTSLRTSLKGLRDDTRVTDGRGAARGRRRLLEAVLVHDFVHGDVGKVASEGGRRRGYGYDGSVGEAMG